MSRLTENSEFYKNVLPKENAVGDTNLQEYYLYVGEYTNKPYYVGKAVDKLSALEDVIEEFGIESAQELKARLQSESQLADAGYKLAMENEDLTKQLSKAIVPKFEIGQEVFYITENCNIKSGEVLEIQKWNLRKDNIIYVIEYKGNVYCESEIFPTQAEAQAKLDEIRRK